VPDVLKEKFNMYEGVDTDSQRVIMENTIKAFASQAYRTILVSYRDMSMDQYRQLEEEHNNFETEADRECLEDELVALCIFGLQDPLRPTIVKSVEQCLQAGITVIMCTGDNIDTATAISINAGIITKEDAEKEYACMTGAEFREAVGPIKKVQDKNGEDVDVVTNLQKFRQIKKNLRVMARSSPDDKYLLVTGIQQCEGVVAVTGDGSNDAPALTKADVGFAMGITGTDIAKGACDIILLDDNFASIIVALEYGRCVYDNVRKFLQFQLTINIVALYICFVSSAILRDSPLNAVEMLWINLIMDTFGACALASEPPAKEILTRKPYKKDNPIITAVMWRNILGHAVFQMIMVSVLIFAGSGTVTYGYQTKCLNYSDDAQTNCTEWNPFFSDELYQTAATKKWWTNLNLTRDDFNSEALNNFVCQHNFEKTGVKTCDKSIWEDESKWVLPQDLEVGYKNQKLLHYTIIF
jgi:Ca2+ transporting ATPase